MANCPGCSHDIDYLMAQSTLVRKFYFEVGEPVYEDPDSEPETDYYCPNCDRVVASTQDEAEEILEEE